ncbi:MAG TPA: hypothetical protein VI968_02160 [archaeon]|nr:hypothetical protein [archaeon]
MKENEFLLLTDMLRGLIKRKLSSEVMRIIEKVSEKLSDVQKSYLAKFIIGEQMYAEKQELIKNESYTLAMRMAEYDYF